MKLIPPDLVLDIQQVLDKAIHPNFRWEQIADLKQQLMTLTEEAPPKKAPRKRK